MSNACSTPLSVETLVAYWFGELDEAKATGVEQHYFACPACTARLEGITRLGDAVIELVRHGGVSASVTRKLVDVGIARGLRVRTYRVEPGQAVACTAAPDDDFIALSLVMPASAIDAVDAHGSIDVAVAWTELASGVQNHRTVSDVSFDRREGELVFLSAGREIRALPKSQWQWTAVLRSPSGEIRLGPYTLDHTPWDQLAHPV